MKKIVLFLVIFLITIAIYGCQLFNKEPQDSNNSNKENSNTTNTNSSDNTENINNNNETSNTNESEIIDSISFLTGGIMYYKPGIEMKGTDNISLFKDGDEGIEFNNLEDFQNGFGVNLNYIGKYLGEDKITALEISKIGGISIIKLSNSNKQGNNIFYVGVDNRLNTKFFSGKGNISNNNMFIDGEGNKTYLITKDNTDINNLKSFDNILWKNIYDIDSNINLKQIYSMKIDNKFYLLDTDYNLININSGESKKIGILEGQNEGSKILIKDKKIIIVKKVLNSIFVNMEAEGYAGTYFQGKYCNLNIYEINAELNVSNNIEGKGICMIKFGDEDIESIIYNDKIIYPSYKTEFFIDEYQKLKRGKLIEFYILIRNGELEKAYELSDKSVELNDFINQYEGINDITIGGNQLSFIDLPIKKNEEGELLFENELIKGEKTEKFQTKMKIGQNEQGNLKILYHVTQKK